MTRKFLTIALLFQFAIPSLQAADAIRNSVVHLHVTRRAPDMFHPWTKASPNKVTGSGAVIAGKRILTNAHVVQFAKQVFVQLQQGGDQLPARVVAVAPRIDLAIVELEDAALLADIEALEMTDALPTIKSTVNVYGYPLGGDDLSVTEGIVSRIEFAQYYYDGAGLRIQVDAALNPGNSGGPAMQDGKMIGLVFSGIKQAENIGYLIPVEEIQTFLADVGDGRYDGKLRIFDRFNKAENAALRDYLKLTPDTTGIVVSTPYQEDKEDALQRWDVITHIGPHDIDNQGYVAFQDDLRIRFDYYVPELAQKGKVPLTLVREGETRQIRLPVTTDRSLLLPSLQDQYPKYFIYGPLVFTAGTQEHMQAMGGKGMAYLSAFDSPLLKRRYDSPVFPGEELVMIATRPFPHPLTHGYGSMALGVVTHLGDVKLKNLHHFAELLRDSKAKFLKLDMAGKSEPLIFRRQEMAAATEEILTDEGIRYQSSAELRDVWP